MIQHTSNKPLSELFSSETKVTYQIPKYQREYVWTKWNWESLFDDIDEDQVPDVFENNFGCDAENPNVHLDFSVFEGYCRCCEVVG